MRAKMHLVALMPILAVLAVCAGPAPLSDNLVKQAAETEFGAEPPYKCIDTIHVAKARGVDYRRVVDGCLARDRRAMSLLFWLSAHAGFDAASSEGHAAFLGTVLRRTGDAFFAQCLAGESAEVQWAVRSDLLNSVYDPNTEKEARQFLRQLNSRYPKAFPRTFLRQLNSRYPKAFPRTFLRQLNSRYPKTFPRAFGPELRAPPSPRTDGHHSRSPVPPLGKKKVSGTFSCQEPFL
jgi:hypothetical protein